MSEELPGWPIIASCDVSFTSEAKELVSRAWAMIEVEYPNNPKVHAQRVARAERLRRLGDHGILANIVAQWLSATALAERMPKAEAKDKQSWRENARKSTETVATLADEVEEMRQHLARLSEALRYEGTTEDGHELSGNAQVIAGCLADALPALRFAQEVAERSLSIMPRGARGSAGIVSALREAPPDTALAIAACRLWLACGLSIDGGKDGDGIDLFLEGLLGPDGSRRALTKARRAVREKL